jgi:hypothetical protein
MTRIVRTGVLVALAAMSVAVPEIRAVSVGSWSASTQEEFAQGTLDGTALDEHGRVRLAPELDTLWGPGQGVVWAVQPDSGDGAAAFVALSGPGRVLHVRSDAEPETWFEAEEETLVTSLIPDGPGRVLFGLSPEGTVKRASRGADGIVVEEVVATDALFVWTLTRQSDGSLWIGTGVPGRVLRVVDDGEPETIFDSGDDPVRCSAALAGGGVVIGTGGRGRVIRVQTDGRAFVLYDADQTEIVSVAALPDGTVFALATESPKQPKPRNHSTASSSGSSTTVVVTASPDVPEPSEEEAAPVPKPPPSPARPPQSFQSRPGGTLYRIDPDGTVREVWSTDREMPFAVVSRADGSLLVGTGDGGRIHTLDSEGRAARLLRIPSEQVSAMATDDAGRVILGGTTDARVEILGPGPRRDGSYLSPAVDAQSIADWGRLLWDAEIPKGTRLEVQVRSGNTAEPDDTWSDWFDAAAGRATGSAATEVPPARWFQSRFRFRSDGDASPRLRRIEVSFQPRNRPPSIGEMRVEQAGVVWVRGPHQTSFSAGPVVADDPVSRRVADSLVRGPRGRNGGAIRRSYEAGARTFSWTADDPDDDRLSFSLSLRREGGTDWFPITDHLDESFYSWDARSVRDGVYRVRLTVDDSLDNPNGTHRKTERVSDAFRIDNTPPSIGKRESDGSGGDVRVRFEALDPGGSVAAVEIALDGAEWTPLSPLDGVADSERERYELVIHEDRQPRPRTLRVRVTDSSGNLGGDMWRLE